MRLEEFIRLSLEEKANFVWQHGLLLDDHVGKDKTTQLFYSPSFYIEIIKANTCGRILEIAGFKTLRRLDKYLKKFTLHELC